MLIWISTYLPRKCRLLIPYFALFKCTSEFFAMQANSLNLIRLLLREHSDLGQNCLHRLYRLPKYIRRRESRRLPWMVGYGLITILAWEFVTRSCLKPQNPCSNHEIHVLFEHGFYLKKPKLGPDLYAWRYTGKSCGRDWPFHRCFRSRKRCPRYMTLWRRNDVRKFDADAILFIEIKRMRRDI